jgi:lipopolysaccharide transport system ATP-binding protein
VRKPFWALRDVSFEITPGEVVGIIGRNGAGKSTLLKLLSRITTPTEGLVELHGRVGSLLEVGTGFHPELSGRENIFLNGAVLGMKRAEIERKFDEIVAFAEVEEFIDTPVKRYSSGMYVRLAFAVAAHLEPEILVIDEVLAVGDAEFQKKCLGKMNSIANREGRTVLFVSHNMIAVQNLCSRAILLDRGKLLFDGDVRQCLELYAARGLSNSGTWKRETVEPDRSLYIETVSARLEGEQPELALSLELRLVSRSWHKPANLAVDIHSSIGAALMQAIPTMDYFIEADSGEHLVNLRISLPPLVPGQYLITVWVGSHHTETLDCAHECVAIEINDSPTKNRTFPHTPDHGYIVPRALVESYTKA